MPLGKSEIHLVNDLEYQKTRTKPRALRINCLRNFTLKGELLSYK